MIKVIVREKANKISYLSISGHAGSAEYGKDLVCAGVSAVIFGGITNFDESHLMNIINDDNLVTIENIELASEHDYIVVETILTSLRLLEHNYGKYIKISEERKKKNETN